MGFLAPWFLGGLLALGLPVYIHLLRQHKTIPLPFSSLMFFERRTQSSVKHRRLKYLLLFALRLLVLLLLALAFANPFVTRNAPAAGGGRKFVVLAVDNSFSMRSAEHLAAAKQAALDAIGSMRAGDVGQVIAFASQANLLTQQIDSPAELRAAVQGISQSDARSSYGEIARVIRSIGQSSRIPVEAHIFTDVQKTSMPSPFSELSVATNTRLVLHPLTSLPPEPNWYVESVTAPKTVYKAKKVRVQAIVSGANTPAASTDVSLVLNGRVLESKTAAVPAAGRASVEFFIADVPYGLNRGEVRIGAHDKLASDDRFLFAMERKEPARVLFIHEARQPRGVLYYREALDSAIDAAFTLDAATADQSANIAPDKYAFVVLSDVASVPAALEDSLKTYVRNGGSVLVLLGPASVARSAVPVSGEAILESHYATRTGERFQAVASMDASHPALQRTNQFDGVRFYQTVAVNPGQSRVLARLSDKSPLMLEKKIGEGRVLTFTSTVDNLSNDMPLHGMFVPFVEKSADYLSGNDQSRADYPVGSYLDLRSAKDQGTAVEVLDPDGKRALSLKEATTSQNLSLTREGFYELRRANGRHELVAVHADRRESDLTPIPKETLELWQNVGSGGQGPGATGSGADTSKPYSLWWYFALVLFLLALIESFVAARYLSVESDEPVLARKEAA